MWVEQVMDEDLLDAVAGELGQVVLRRAIEPEQPVLDELHDQRGGDRLGHRSHGEQRVARERRRVGPRTEDAERPRARRSRRGAPRRRRGSACARPAPSRAHKSRTRDDPLGAHPRPRRAFRPAGSSSSAPRLQHAGIGLERRAQRPGRRCAAPSRRAAPRRRRGRRVRPSRRRSRRGRAPASPACATCGYETPPLRPRQAPHRRGRARRPSAARPASARSPDLQRP